MASKLQTYIFGILWFMLSILSSAINDVFSKYLSTNLNNFEISFFRFLFSTLTLLPFIYYKKSFFKTSYLNIHIIRGILLFMGISAWTYGLTVVQVSTVTVISFSIPLFILVLAALFLKEKITWWRSSATIMGFLGVIITLQPNSVDFNPYTLTLIFAVFTFATLDVINKKFVTRETTINMLFYSSLFTTLLAAPLAYYYWQAPSLSELTISFILGVNANLILFFLLKAFALVDVTAVAPYRYLELLFSSIAAYMTFGELVKKSTVYGGLILILSTLFITYVDSRSIK
ncbi:MAG: DMT family transporter [Wolbachia endosymbiont of Tyrophagus putrescentiae]|nr:DMT family transporter [Wolbachia endosymbiont of Tyrophagus putrescentiae]